MKTYLKWLLLAAVLLVTVYAEEEEEVINTDNSPRITKRAIYTEPAKPPGNVFFWETFSDKEAFNKRWIPSKAQKDDTDASIAKYNGQWLLTNPINVGGFTEDQGLVLTEAAKHYAISAKLDKPFVFSGSETFVMQYEINFQDTLTCGGGYVKLLSSADDLSQFRDKTPYSIMFGPDRCGQSSKLHFIVRFKNPKTGEIEEKHSGQATGIDHIFTDKMTHLYTLVINNDDTYSIAVDQQVVFNGNLLKDMTPSIVPPEEIDDPNDKKPENWDDREKIPDPEATKPDDWDEDAPQKIPDPDATKPESWLDDGPEMIPDPDATKPDDWDEDEDGTWEAPMIPNPACDEVGCGEWTPPMIANPAYKGKWRPSLIDNPNYMGVWAAKRIPNPGYFELEGTAYSKLTAVEAIGFELWSMSKDIFFDNIVITGELASASAFALQGWLKKVENERKETGSDSLGPWLDYFIDIANEYPYLWALYAVVIVLPFVICAACCVRPKSPPTKTDDAARKKKTDEPSPDDPRPLEEPSITEINDTKENSETFVASSEDEEKDKSKEETEVEEEQEKEKTVKERAKKEKKKEEEKDEVEEQEEEGFQPRKSPRRGKRTKREE